MDKYYFYEIVDKDIKKQLYFNKFGLIDFLESHTEFIEKEIGINKSDFVIQRTGIPFVRVGSMYYRYNKDEFTQLGSIVGNYGEKLYPFRKKSAQLAKWNTFLFDKHKGFHLDGYSPFYTTELFGNNDRASISVVGRHKVARYDERWFIVAEHPINGFHYKDATIQLADNQRVVSMTEEDYVNTRLEAKEQDAEYTAGKQFWRD